MSMNRQRLRVPRSRVFLPLVLLQFLLRFSRYCRHADERASCENFTRAIFSKNHQHTHATHRSHIDGHADSRASETSPPSPLVPGVFAGLLVNPKAALASKTTFLRRFVLEPTRIYCRNWIISIVVIGRLREEEIAFSVTT